MPTPSASLRAGPVAKNARRMGHPGIFQTRRMHLFEKESLHPSWYSTCSLLKEIQTEADGNPFDFRHPKESCGLLFPASFLLLVFEWPEEAISHRRRCLGWILVSALGSDETSLHRPVEPERLGWRSGVARP